LTGQARPYIIPTASSDIILLFPRSILARLPPGTSEPRLFSRNYPFTQSSMSQPNRDKLFHSSRFAGAPEVLKPQGDAASSAPALKAHRRKRPVKKVQEAAVPTAVKPEDIGRSLAQARQKVPQAKLNAKEIAKTHISNLPAPASRQTQTPAQGPVQQQGPQQQQQQHWRPPPQLYQQQQQQQQLNSRLRISIQGSPSLGISIRKMPMDSYYSFFKRLLRRFLTRKVHSSQHIPRPS
jgi:hypothetical protein